MKWCTADCRSPISLKVRPRLSWMCSSMNCHDRPLYTLNACLHHMLQFLTLQVNRTALLHGLMPACTTCCSLLHCRPTIKALVHAQHLPAPLTLQADNRQPLYMFNAGLHLLHCTPTKNSPYTCSTPPCTTCIPYIAGQQRAALVHTPACTSYIAGQQKTHPQPKVH